MNITVLQLAMKGLLFSLILISIQLVSGCASNEKPLPMADYVDIDQFMGRWYVHGYTPILVDKSAHNAIEHYRMDEDRKIQTTYQFRDGGFDGEIKTYNPVGWVHDTKTNAEWRMRFIWPFRSQYIILHVDENYSETIIAHSNRKYAWIMLRKPEVSDEDYARLMGKLKAAGYDLAIIQRMPHNWEGERERFNTLATKNL